MNFILHFYYFYKKDDKVIKKETFIRDVYGVITLEIDTDYFTKETNFEMVKSRYGNLSNIKY